LAGVARKALYDRWSTLTVAEYYFLFITHKFLLLQKCFNSWPVI